MEANVMSGTIRVMLVNEHPLSLWALEKLIEEQGTRMRVSAKARTPAQAREMLALHPSDVVLMDLDCEGMNDMERFFAGTDARVLVLSSSTDPEVLDAAVLSGAAGVVYKGEQIDVLLKAIERVNLGELWIDRSATSRIVRELSTRNHTAQPDPERAKLSLLTRKELQTVTEVARDASSTSREIAARLDISEHTLRNHLSSIYAKLGLRNRVDLFAYANRNGFPAKA